MLFETSALQILNWRRLSASAQLVKSGETLMVSGGNINLIESSIASALLRAKDITISAFFDWTIFGFVDI